MISQKKASCYKDAEVVDSYPQQSNMNKVKTVRVNSGETNQTIQTIPHLGLDLEKKAENDNQKDDSGSIFEIPSFKDFNSIENATKNSAIKKKFDTAENYQIMITSPAISDKNRKIIPIDQALSNKYGIGKNNYRNSTLKYELKKLDVISERNSNEYTGSQMQIDTHGRSNEFELTEKIKSNDTILQSEINLPQVNQANDFDPDLDQQNSNDKANKHGAGDSGPVTLKSILFQNQASLSLLGDFNDNTNKPGVEELSPVILEPRVGDSNPVTLKSILFQNQASLSLLGESLIREQKLHPDKSNEFLKHPEKSNEFENNGSVSFDGIIEKDIVYPLGYDK